jgi:ABC-type bacteriocin/lantibiotic exporter with double-glycine peptidase domain
MEIVIAFGDFLKSHGDVCVSQLITFQTLQHHTSHYFSVLASIDD